MCQFYFQQCLLFTTESHIWKDLCYWFATCSTSSGVLASTLPCFLLWEMVRVFKLRYTLRLSAYTNKQTVSHSFSQPCFRLLKAFLWCPQIFGIFCRSDDKRSQIKWTPYETFVGYVKKRAWEAGHWRAKVSRPHFCRIGSGSSNSKGNFWPSAISENYTPPITSCSSSQPTKRLLFNGRLPRPKVQPDKQLLRHRFIYADLGVRQFTQAPDNRDLKSRAWNMSPLPSFVLTSALRSNPEELDDLHMEMGYCGWSWPFTAFWIFFFCLGTVWLHTASVFKQCHLNALLSTKGHKNSS